MRVFFDGAIYSIQKYGGINRYFKNLMEHFPEAIESTLVTSVIPPDFPAEVRILESKAPGWLSHHKITRRWAEARIGRSIFNRGQPDIIHPTYFRSLTRDSFQQIKNRNNRNVPVVYTVYDFTHERFQDQIKHSARQIKWKSNAIQRADAIICISESTKNDLGEYYPDALDKAVVIYLADELGKAKSSSLGIEDTVKQKYFLFVGGRNDYKNFSKLLLAMRIVRKTDESHQLVCVGASFTENEWKEIDELGLSSAVRSVGRVGDSQLKSLYENCAAFVFPSCYEGFGIPLLEAMGCEAPILASNQSCFPEILDGVGLLFDPTNENEMADQMLQIVDCRCDREKLIEDGLRRYQAFSWRRRQRRRRSCMRSSLGELTRHASECFLARSQSQPDA